MSLIDGDKGKGPVEQDNKSGSDLDPEDLKIIDSRTTQVEIRIEGGSRTITIPMNRDL